MTDLDKLIEAVEAGGLPKFPVSCRAVGGIHAVNVDGAFGGMLDDAKSLHDALLPGWEFDLGSAAGGTYYACLYDGKTVRDASADFLSRAWLLAILKAYRS